MTVLPRVLCAVAFCLVSGSAFAKSHDHGGNLADLDDIFPYADQQAQCTAPQIVKHMTPQQRADCRYLLKYGHPRW